MVNKMKNKEMTLKEVIADIGQLMRRKDNGIN